MRILKTDLLDILLACTNGTLSEIDIEWESKYASCVTIASCGYPGVYKKGAEIRGLDSNISGIEIFHAGTKNIDGRIVTSGGRVLNVTAVGNTLEESLKGVYTAVTHINFDGMHFRKDIGRKSLLRQARSA